MAGTVNALRLMGRHYRPTGLEPQTLPIVAAFATPPSEGRARVMDRYVRGLLRADIFYRLGVYQVWDRAQDSQSSLINWANPSQSAGLVDPTGAGLNRTPDGWACIASGAYIALGVTPQSMGGRFGQDDAHVGVILREAGAVRLVGQVSSQRVGLLGGSPMPSLRGQLNSGGNFPHAVEALTGHLITVRNGPAAVEHFRNGELIGADAVASSAKNNIALDAFRTQSSSFGIGDRLGLLHLGLSLSRRQREILEELHAEFIAGIDALEDEAA